jgi:hypothetical protein
MAVCIIPNLPIMFNKNLTIFGKKLATKAQREKSLSGNQVIRKWISGEQENREDSVKRISPFEKLAKKVFY